TSKLRTTTSRRKQRSSNTTRQTRNAEAQIGRASRREKGSNSLHTSNTTLSNRQRRRKSRQGIIKRADNSQGESGRLSRQAQRRSSDRHNSRPGHSRTGSSQTHSSRTGSSRTSKLRTTTSRRKQRSSNTTRQTRNAEAHRLSLTRSQQDRKSTRLNYSNVSNTQPGMSFRQKIIKRADNSQGESSRLSRQHQRRSNERHTIRHLHTLPTRRSSDLSRTGSSRTSKLRTTTSRRKQRSSNTTRQTRNAEAHRLSLTRSQ